MKQQLQHRLQQLKTEFESGQKALADIEAKQTNIQHTMLRIQGAIQVLEEELASAEDDVPKELSSAEDTSQNLTEAHHSSANGFVEVATNAHGWIPHHL